MKAVSVQEAGEGRMADPTESSDEESYLVCDLRSPLARHRGPRAALSVDPRRLRPKWKPRTLRAPNSTRDWS